MKITSLQRELTQLEEKEKRLTKELEDVTTQMKIVRKELADITNDGRIAKDILERVYEQRRQPSTSTNKKR